MLVFIYTFGTLDRTRTYKNHDLNAVRLPIAPQEQVNTLVRRYILTTIFPSIGNTTTHCRRARKLMSFSKSPLV